jgi:hypothetical protein
VSSGVDRIGVDGIITEKGHQVDVLWLPFEYTTDESIEEETKDPRIQASKEIQSVLGDDAKMKRKGRKGYS